IKLAGTRLYLRILSQGAKYSQQHSTQLPSQFVLALRCLPSQPRCCRSDYGPDGPCQGRPLLLAGYGIQVVKSSHKRAPDVQVAVVQERSRNRDKLLERLKSRNSRGPRITYNAKPLDRL